MNTKEMTTSEMLSRLLDIPEQVLGSRSLKELMTAPLSVQGIREESLEKLYLLNEISRRWAIAESEEEGISLNCPSTVAEYLRPFFRYETKEHFKIVILNAKNKVLNVSNISTGSLTSSVVEPREVFKEALRYSAASIIMAHNHPSGEPQPSRADQALTKRLVKVGKLMSIPVLDHIIIAHDKWLSFREAGLI
jgi:DNA repair protein RadC